jgi:D-cysteine desulfhydrase family pyridoxal phosphate-dependent enzyme
MSIGDIRQVESAMHTKHEFSRFPLMGSGHGRFEHWKRLSDHLGGPAIFAQRDDISGLAFGGNKLRKFEYLIGDALARGCNAILTSGALQSNSARLAAAAAARAGMKCHLVLRREVRRSSEAYERSGNRLLQDLLGAKIRIIEENADIDAELERERDAMSAAGLNPYWIVLGGSNALGNYGYVRAATEIREFQRDCGVTFNYIWVASGTGGTQAGLIVGAHLAGLVARVVGGTVSRSASAQTEQLTRKLSDLAEFLDVRDLQVSNVVHLNDRCVAPGYGIPNEAGREALDLCATLEGVLLDPVYTAKAMATLIGDIRAGKITREDKVLFIHTGGAPGLFAYWDIF